MLVEMEIKYYNDTCNKKQTNLDTKLMLNRNGNKISERKKSLLYASQGVGVGM